MTLDLDTRDGSLQLDVGDDEWCRVAVRIGDRRWILGAETRAIVVGRLRDAMSDPIGGKPAGSIEGVHVSWLLSLSEQHGSMYGADVADGRRLWFRDRAANDIGSLTLSPDERKRWREQLDA